MAVRADALSLFGIAQTTALGTADLGMDDRGGAFYTIMTFGVAAMLQAQERGAAALVMVIAVMVTDGVWNYLLFRRRRLDWAYWYLFPYTVLVATTTIAVFTIDVPAGGLIAIYLAFLPYDFAWTKALATLNPDLAHDSGQ
ncbi:tryptophan-rich sensory protein [Mesorhizobium onobrychidis]|uniref:Tryptophan-rich sensory protein n=1 Tax=Mesorhizobium onobrychidis TaxID=2775404 RepID=A0ABY5R4I0_9HYPH|nr:tryptophan-rich sensory protein [Mesorhizobium onobrychidis]UVC18410.1 tryptophan-rich sensory protein [Mesorhizobium onobrychidis]